MCVFLFLLKMIFPLTYTIELKSCFPLLFNKSANDMSKHLEGRGILLFGIKRVNNRFGS